MKRIMKQIYAFLLIALFCGLFTPGGVHAQTNSILIELLSQESKPITTIVDGNRIQLRAEVSKAVSAETQVDLFLDESLISSCTIAANETACTTEFIETLGWGWADSGIQTSQRTIKARAENEAGETVVQVKPRPVVLVHGLISTADKFSGYLNYLNVNSLQGYIVGDGQFDGTMNMGDLANPSAPTSTIAENAAQLDTYIEGVKQATGAEQVDLIAHSMGGLVSRYYIHQLMNEDDVAQLIMLGTPNGGSKCGGALASLGFYFPASLELQPSYLNDVFNTQVTNTRGVPFHAVAGSFITDPAISPCSGVPSDSSVSQASVQAIPLQLLGIPPLEHNFLVTDESAFRDLVLPLLQTTAEGFASQPSPAPAANPKPEQFTQTFTGHLEKDGSDSITIPIDPNVSVASFGLYDSTQSLQISVQGASGNSLELDLQNKGLVITDPQTLLYLGYGFEDPKPGAWVVTLTSSERTPATGADYALYARFTGGATLRAQASEFTVTIGKPVTFTAALEGGEIESAQAVILLPDGERQQIELTKSEEGFTAEYSPQLAGLHGAEIIVIGNTADGFPIHRAASLVIEAHAEQTTASFPITNIAIGIGAALMILLIVFFIRRRK